MYLFIFGCASLHCCTWAFSGYRAVGATLLVVLAGFSLWQLVCYGAWVSPMAGFSSCRTSQTSGTQFLKISELCFQRSGTKIFPRPGIRPRPIGRFPPTLLPRKSIFWQYFIRWILDSFLIKTYDHDSWNSTFQSFKCKLLTWMYIVSFLLSIWLPSPTPALQPSPGHKSS